MSLQRLYAAAIVLQNRSGEMLTFCCSGARADGESFLAEHIARLLDENPGYRAISQVLIRVSDDAVARAGYVPVFTPPITSTAQEQP